MRTTIDINDRLMKETLRATGLKTTRGSRTGVAYVAAIDQAARNPQAPRKTALEGRSGRDEERPLILLNRDRASLLIANKPTAILHTNSLKCNFTPRTAHRPGAK